MAVLWHGLERRRWGAGKLRGMDCFEIERSDHKSLTLYVSNAIECIPLIGPAPGRASISFMGEDRRPESGVEGDLL